MLTETTVRELYELTFGADIEKDQIEYVFLQGWIRTNRAGKNIAKANELKGEGSEIIQEEIANAVQGLIFEAPGLGDLM